MQTDALPDGWVTRPLAEWAVWHSGGTPRKSEPSYWGGEIPWISAKSLNDFHIWDSQDRVTQKGSENGTRLVPRGAVLFIVRGMSLTTEFRIGIAKAPVTFNQDLKALVAKPGVDSLYMAYAIKSRTHQILGFVDNASHGTGRLQTSLLSSLEIELPPIAEQRRIAAVLGALDDKIAANRRMNASLDALAGTLFRERFGRYVPGDVLPEEWRWGQVSDLIAVDPRTPLKKGAEAKYVGMSELPTTGFQIGQIETKPYAGGARFRQGDTLLARITPCLENGKTTFVDFLDADEVAFGSTEFIVLRALPGTPPAFAYILSRDHAFRRYVIGHMSGSSGRQRASGGDVARYALPIPPEDELASFGASVGHLLDRASANHCQNRTLAALRDTLLPKLVSGEVRVSEVENETLAVV